MLRDRVGFSPGKDFINIFLLVSEIHKFDEKSQFDQFYVIERNFQFDYQIELKFHEGS